MTLRGATQAQHCCTPRPLVFLDVDGVLNIPGRSAPEALEPQPLQNLVLLLRKTGAQVVLYHMSHMT